MIRRYGASELIVCLAMLRLPAAAQLLSATILRGEPRLKGRSS
jgi:hypothetical protein